MKNNKAIIIIAIVLLNVLVVFMLGQSLMGKASKYDLKLEEARALRDGELYARAISAYEEAAGMEDTAELRVEMIAAFDLGLTSGEFTKTYSIFNDVEDYVEAFHDDVTIYEAACELYCKYGDYERCAETLRRAKKEKLSSDKLTEILRDVQFRYEKHYSMYGQVMPEFDGMYAFEKNGLYGYLNSEASTELESIYTSATAFYNGYAVVSMLNIYGEEQFVVIDKDGQRYAYLEGIDETSGVGGAKDEDGKAQSLIACKTGDTYKYYNLDGEVVFGDYAYAGRFRNNIAAVQDSTGKWQLIDGTGKPIVDMTFTDVVLNEFEECAPKGLIIAQDGDKYHIYDTAGERVGNFGCDYAKAFVDQYAAFEKDGLWGFVDADGNVLIEPQYDDAKSFSNGLGAVMTSNGWSLVNSDNEVITQEYFEDLGYLSSKGVCFVKTRGYWSYITVYYTNA